MTLTVSIGTKSGRLEQGSIFPVYTSTLWISPLIPESTDTLGFFGLYCRSLDFHLNGTTCSSVDIFSPGMTIRTLLLAASMNDESCRDGRSSGEVVRSVQSSGRVSLMCNSHLTVSHHVSGITSAILGKRILLLQFILARDILVTLIRSKIPLPGSL